LTEQPQRGGAGETRSEIDSTRIKGDVVQARDVSGGVHFHASPSGPNNPRVVPRQLPADVSAFVNRQPELRALTRLTGTRSGSPAPHARVQPTAVVVISGSAGVGKTALALHWAHLVRDWFPDGELYANLRGFDEEPPVSAGTALDRFLRDLGVASEAIPADLDGRAALFRSLIAGRRILIVLDNAADTGQVRPLIPGGPGPLLLVTSRNQLPGLAIRDGAQRIQLDIFQESDAVALLRRVTRTGGRRDTPADLTELARLCARLPLALRVAAEHAVSRPAMGLAELIADLRDDSMLWDALSTGEEPHGEAVRTVFTWSYRDLPADAAGMFRALGLHRGPDISLSAAAAARGIPARSARRALDILIGAFLVEAPRPGRYQLHDLLRAYALDQARMIDSETDRRETMDRILRWYIVTASHASMLLSPGDSFPLEVPAVAGPDLLSFATPAAVFEWFDIERPNLVANARAAIESGLPRRAWELAMASGPVQSYYLTPVQSYYLTFDDRAALSELAVAAAEELADRPMLASALSNRGMFLFRRGLLDDAKTAHSRALKIRQKLGDERGVLESLNALGLIGLNTRELPQAAVYFTDVAAKARGIGDPWWDGVARSNLAEAYLESGALASALEILTPLPRVFAGLQEPAYESSTLWVLSRAQREVGNQTAALTAINAALHIAENTGNRAWEAYLLTESARVHLAIGSTEEAMRCCRMATSLQHQIGNPSRDAAALDCTGEVLLAMGNAEEAAAFHREAARMHRQLGYNWREALALVHLADCEAALGREDASREQAARALTLIQAFGDDRAARLKADLRARLA
jgi:tetratricopeptide (TPR) repeat protein